MRTLEVLVRQAAGDAAGGAAGDETLIPRSQLLEDASEDTDRIDGEPLAEWRVSCPRRVRSLWREVVELARRMVGAQCAEWQAAEAIAAEGLSSGEHAHTGGVSDDEGSTIASS